MKTKYVSILVALLIGAQSTFACEFCGVKNEAHGQVLSLALVVARALSALSDTYGTEIVESYYNSVEEPGDPILTEKDEDLGEEDEKEEIAEIQPLYLVGENHFNLVDQRFDQEIAAAAGRGALIYPSEGIDYEEDDNGAPVQTDGLPLYGTEDPFALTVTNFITIRSILNFAEADLYDVNTLEKILNDFIDLINQMIEPRNEAFTAALYANEGLQANPLLEWIVTYKEALLKKDAKARDATLRKSLGKFILGKKSWFFKNIKPFLDQAIPLLLAHASTLPQDLQIPQRFLNYLTAVDQIDLLQVCKILAYWRNLFVIENLKKLHAHANSLDLPMVVVFGHEHIQHISEGLQNAGLTVASDIQDLPISGPIKNAKQQRINEGKFDV